MGLFETFWSWLNSRLTDYIGTNTALIAAALEPAVVTIGTIYVMVWGYLHLTGRTEEPFITGLRRIVTLAVVLGVSLRLWLYNTIVVDSFYEAPVQLAAAITGASDPVKTVDAIWDRGGAVAGFIWGHRPHLWSLDFYLAAIIVWLFIGLLCVYTMFLIALSSIALSILLALGPLFFPMLLFDSTRRFFEMWVAQLANYALITILTVLASSLLLQIVQTYAEQTAALGSTLLTVDALDMILVSALVFLFMRQVMPIASGLAGGVSLNTFGMVGRTLRGGLEPLRSRSMRIWAFSQARLYSLFNSQLRAGHEERARPGRGERV